MRTFLLLLFCVSSAASAQDVFEIHCRECKHTVTNAAAPTTKRGLFELKGEPFLIHIVGNPDASPDKHNRFRVVRIKDKKMDEDTVYTYHEKTSTWDMADGMGKNKKTTSRTETVDPATKDKTTIVEIKDYQDKLIERTLRISRRFPSHDSVLRSEVFKGGKTNITVYTYYNDRKEKKRYGELKQALYPDGSWKRKEYNLKGYQLSEVRSIGPCSTNTPDDKAYAIYYDHTPVDAKDTGVYANWPRRKVVKRLGKIISAEYSGYYMDSKKRLVTIKEYCPTGKLTPYGSPENRRTESTR